MREYKHRDAGGNQIYVAEMKNDHLSNTIKFIIRTIESLYNMLDGTSNISARSNVFYKTRMSKRQIEEKIREYTDNLKEYIFEAMLRGISFTEELQKLYDRKEAIIVPNNMLVLTQSSSDKTEFDFSTFSGKSKDDDDTFSVDAFPF